MTLFSAFFSDLAPFRFFLLIVFAKLYYFIYKQAIIAVFISALHLPQSLQIVSPVFALKRDYF